PLGVLPRELALEPERHGAARPHQRVPRQAGRQVDAASIGLDEDDAGLFDPGGVGAVDLRDDYLGPAQHELLEVQPPANLRQQQPRPYGIAPDEGDRRPLSAADDVDV